MTFSRDTSMIPALLGAEGFGLVKGVGMRWTNLLSIWVVTGLFAACTTPAPVLSPRLRPGQTPEVLAALSGAKVCDAPVTAAVQLSAGFKYGCFCGKGHPAVSIPDGAGTPQDRKAALVQAFLAIRPIDSIDEACRDHDVCWIIHRDGSGECNTEFGKRLRFLSDYFQSNDRNSTKSLEWRCSIVARDMAAAFLTIFVDDVYESEATTAGSTLGRIFATPMTALMPVLRAPVWAGEPSARVKLLVASVTQQSAECLLGSQPL